MVAASQFLGHHSTPRAWFRRLTNNRRRFHILSHGSQHIRLAFSNSMGIRMEEAKVVLAIRARNIRLDFIRWVSLNVPTMWTFSAVFLPFYVQKALIFRIDIWRYQIVYVSIFDDALTTWASLITSGTQ
jgi:hypothetical protein